MPPTEASAAPAPAAETSDPLRHHTHYGKDEAGKDKPLFGDSIAERVAEAVASGMGTVPFILVATAVILGWTFANHLVHFLTDSWNGLLNGRGFDPAPYILLNLVFSAVAFFTGALVIIAQKSQAKRDRANEEASSKHREELAEQQLELLRLNTELTKKIDDLTTQIHATTCGGKPASAP